MYVSSDTSPVNLKRTSFTNNALTMQSAENGCFPELPEWLISI